MFIYYIKVGFNNKHIEEKIPIINLFSAISKRFHNFLILRISIFKLTVENTKEIFSDIGERGVKKVIIYYIQNKLNRTDCCYMDKENEIWFFLCQNKTLEVESSSFVVDKKFLITVFFVYIIITFILTLLEVLILLIILQIFLVVFKFFSNWFYNNTTVQINFILRYAKRILYGTQANSSFTTQAIYKKPVKNIEHATIYLDSITPYSSQISHAQYRLLKIASYDSNINDIQISITTKKITNGKTNLAICISPNVFNNNSNINLKLNQFLATGEIAVSTHKNLINNANCFVNSEIYKLVESSAIFALEKNKMLPLNFNRFVFPDNSLSEKKIICTANTLIKQQGVNDLFVFNSRNELYCNPQFDLDWITNTKINLLNNYSISAIFPKLPWKIDKTCFLSDYLANQKKENFLCNEMEENQKLLFGNRTLADIYPEHYVREFSKSGISLIKHKKIVSLKQNQNTIILPDNFSKLTQQQQKIIIEIALEKQSGNPLLVINDKNNLIQKFIAFDDYRSPFKKSLMVDLSITDKIIDD